MNYKTYVEKVLQHLDALYTVEHIMTPREHMVCYPDSTEPDKLHKESQKFDFDCIPLTGDNEGKTIVGLYYRDRGKIVPLSEEWLIGHDTSIFQLLVNFNNQGLRCFLVVQKDTIAGIVTPADLNKVPTRAYVYGYIALMEQLLGDGLRQMIDMVEEGSSPLERQKQYLHRKLNKSWKKIEGFFCKSKKDGMEVDYVACMSLSEVIKALEDTDFAKNLMKVCGKKKKPDPSGESKLRACLKNILELRNWVAHPVKDSSWGKNQEGERLKSVSPEELREEIDFIRSFCKEMAKLLNKLENTKLSHR